MSVCKWLSATLLRRSRRSPAPAFAQGEQGRIAGIVRDQSDAFVAGATVKVKNERTGEERRP